MIAIGLIATLVLFFLMFLEARSDGKKGDPTHTLDWIIRAVLGLSVCFIMFHGYSIWTKLAYGLVLMFTSWPLFNITYNYYSFRKDWRYVGKTALEDKLYRKWFPKSYQDAMLLTQIIGIISSLVFLYYSL
jgi:hypothetical protein